MQYKRRKCRKKGKFRERERIKDWQLTNDVLRRKKHLVERTNERDCELGFRVRL